MKRLCEMVKQYGPLGGRVLMAAIFVMSGSGKIAGFAGTAAYILFMIPTTLIFHNFWAVDAAQAQAQTIHFMKNLAIMGGLLYVIALGAGPCSLDNRRRRRIDPDVVRPGACNTP